MIKIEYDTYRMPSEAIIYVEVGNVVNMTMKMGDVLVYYMYMNFEPQNIDDLRNDKKVVEVRVFNLKSRTDVIAFFDYFKGLGKYLAVGKLYETLDINNIRPHCT
jgi:hypothetical protein